MQKNHDNDRLIRDRVEFRLKMSPMASILPDRPMPLPNTPAPCLDNIEIKLAIPKPLDSQDMARRFHEKKRMVATTRERVRGEHIAIDDDAQLNILAYCKGKLVPFSPRFGSWMEMRPIAGLPGLVEAIAQNGKVGESIVIDLVLPDNYPVESLRGAKTKFIIDIIAARELSILCDDSPELLIKLGLGPSLRDVMDRIRDELESERGLAFQQEIRDSALHELARHANPDVSDSLIDEEIKRCWASAEGKELVARNFSVDEQREALDGWLGDSSTRAQTKARLQIGLALSAIAEKEKLSLAPDQLMSVLTKHAASLGFSEEELKSALKESKSIAQKLASIGFHLHAVDYVMSKIKINIH